MRSILGFRTPRLVKGLKAIMLAVGIAALGPAVPFAAPQSENLPPTGVLESFNIGGVEARTGALLLSGQAGGNVEGALTWSLAGHDESGRLDVPFVIEVDGGALLAGRSSRRMVIGIYAYVVDGEGRVADHIAQGLVLDSDVYRDKISGSGLKFIGRFTLEPGDYTLRVMVQNKANSSYFMSWSILALPVAEDHSPRLLPPLFPDPETPWTVARQYGEDIAFAVDEGGEILPAAKPRLVENRSAEVYIGGGGWDESAIIEVRILNEIGRTVSEPLVRFGDPPVGGFQFRRISLPPVDLPPGEYSLVVTLADENTGEVLRRATRLTVVGEEETRGWAGAGDPANIDGASASGEGSEAGKKLNKKEIRAAYRRALRPLGDGDAVTARRLVAKLERRLVVGNSWAAESTLSEAELAEARALAKKNPTCLMPLALLHRDLYRGYSARREGLLSSHARKMAITYGTPCASTADSVPPCFHLVSASSEYPIISRPLRYTKVS
jgi:hypothetical protein